MQPKDLNQFTLNEEMKKYDAGIGVITFYQLNNGMSYLVMGEYHNKGALSPTVGARLDKDKDQSFYDCLEQAFERKRLGGMCLGGSDIDDDNIYYSVNKTQNFARVTFVQNVELNLSESQFKTRYVDPIHTEAEHQSAVSSFFWQLENNGFKTNMDRAKAAETALNHISASHFGMSETIIARLKALQNESYQWQGEVKPLAFYGQHGGRKYSEMTGFYLMSVKDILQQLKTPELKSGGRDAVKPTVFIAPENVSKANSWKKFFIFEDEIKVVAAVLNDFQAAKTNTMTTFAPSGIAQAVKELQSPWSVEKVNAAQFKLLEVPQNPAFSH